MMRFGAGPLKGDKCPVLECAKVELSAAWSGRSKKRIDAPCPPDEGMATE